MLWKWHKNIFDDATKARMRTFPTNNHNSRRRWRGSRYVVFALFALVLCWMICFLVLINGRKADAPVLRADPELSRKTTDGQQQQQQQHTREQSLQPHQLSRSGNVTATADVRGNLGPAQVVVQPNPGKDWIHDRWQAASNMHGKNIPGAHWIQLDFGKEIVPQKIILDWEAAYADKYRLEASLEPISGETPGDNVWILFDAADTSQIPHRSVKEAGQSPGVKTKTPLHVIHTIDPLQSNRPLRYLRLYILKSAMGWGVSLWQFDVIGFHKDEVTQ